MSFLDLNYDFYPSNLSYEEMNSEGWNDGQIKVKEYIFVEVLVALFAVTGNALVITVFCKEKRLRKKSNYYIISLACADFCVGICGIPLAILLIVTGLPSHHLICHIGVSILFTFCNISILNLLLISIDRFVAILLPFNNPIKSKFVIAEILLCWLIGFFIGFLPMLGWRKETCDEKCLLYDVVTDGYQIFRFILIILIPACAMLVIYIVIYKIIITQLKHDAALGTPPSSTCDKISQSSQVSHRILFMKEVKTTVKLSLIVLIFILSWFPLQIINVLGVVCKTCKIDHNIIAFSMTIAHSNSAINPILYAYHLKDVRRAILSIFKIH